jgi:hypothetical protein
LEFLAGMTDGPRPLATSKSRQAVVHFWTLGSHP